MRELVFEIGYSYKFLPEKLKKPHRHVTNDLSAPKLRRERPHFILGDPRRILLWRLNLNSRPRALGSVLRLRQMFPRSNQFIRRQ
jgi:hypothetical protein